MILTQNLLPLILDNLYAESVHDENKFPLFLPHCNRQPNLGWKHRSLSTDRFLFSRGICHSRHLGDLSTTGALLGLPGSERVLTHNFEFSSKPLLWPSEESGNTGVGEKLLELKRTVFPEAELVF